MIPLLHGVKLNGSILEIGILPDSLVVLDNFYNLYQLERRTFGFQKSLRITKSYEPQHKFNKSLASSIKGHTVITLNKSTKGIVLKVEESVEKITLLTWHKADISTATFSPCGKFLATGGEDGRTLIYQVPGFSLLTTLPPRPDYIASAIFSSDSTLIAVSCFDHTTVVFDLERNLKIASFETSEVVEDIGFFDDNKQLFFICKDGTTGIFSIESKSITRQERQFSQWLTTLCITEDGNYAYVGTRDNLLHIISTKDNTLLTSIQTEPNGISALKLFEGQLYIGYVDGHLEILDLERDMEEFKTYLKINELVKAKALAEKKNIFLKTSPLYIQKLNELWKETLKEAIDLLAKDKFQSALALVSPFIEDSTKKEEFSYYAEQKAFVAQFLDALENRDLAEAYKIAESHEEIFKLSAYEKLEEYWRKTFEVCKKLLASNPQGGLPKAQELLKPFAGVRSKKESVYTLLHNSDKYTAADTLLKERSYAEYFKLTEKFPFLKETETYKKAYLLGQQLIDKIALLEDSQEFDKALEITKFLGMLLPFKTLALERSKLINKKREFLQACSAGELKKAYTLIEREENLKALPEYVQLIDRFNATHERAHELASKGASANVLVLLEEYLEIPYWEDKIATTMKVAYLYEIRAAAIKHSPEEIDWAKSLYAYVERFSKDDELAKVCEAGKIKNYFDEITHKGDSQGYKNLPYLSSIIVFFE